MNKLVEQAGLVGLYTATTLASLFVIEQIYPGSFTQILKFLMLLGLLLYIGSEIHSFIQKAKDGKVNWNTWVRGGREGHAGGDDSRPVVGVPDKRT